MSDERLFIVGDVQGCADELEDLLRQARLDDGRRLAFAGDLINRGPRSKAALERAVAEDALVVVGNHEDGLLQGKGGETLDRVRAELGDELPRWLAWLGTLPTFVRRPGLILVHAGIAPGKTPETCTRAELTRIREVDGRPWFDAWRGPEVVVFGHWATRGKVDLPLCKGLDTGCVYGGALTGLYWPELSWLSVPAHRRWFDHGTMKPTW
jgi:bis(5'-nucleosyl)-tetraphosphatase (symmetrical)